jgi:hypothetical protein
MEKFIRELRAAKNRGVNVSKIFVEDEERLALMHTKTFGLRLAILWVFFAPVALVAFEAFCIERGLQVSVPHDLVYWTCGMGFVSILAFGFDLVDLAALWRGVVRFIRPMPLDKTEHTDQSITVKIVVPSDEADGDV